MPVSPWCFSCTSALCCTSLNSANSRLITIQSEPGCWPVRHLRHAAITYLLPLGGYLPGWSAIKSSSAHDCTSPAHTWQMIERANVEFCSSNPGIVCPWMYDGYAKCTATQTKWKTHAKFSPTEMRRRVDLAMLK